MTKITLLDGGMGQELIARAPNKPTGLFSAQALLDDPELITAVHSDYFKVGADIATTASYAIQRDRLDPIGLGDQFEAMHHQACRLAVKARDGFGSGRVAGSLGPLGWSYRPDLAPPVDKAAALYAEIVQIQGEYVDFFLIETMSSVEQARGALMGATAVSKPIWLSISVDDEDGAKLRSGEPVQAILPLLTEYNIEALLVNCSIPEAITQAITQLVNNKVPVGGYANGFTKITSSFKEKGSTVEALAAREDLGPDRYANHVGQWLKDGATIIGGCCEVGPAHIQELANRYKR
ncbi:MAG: homocysteine S-methyltransferase family protein [Chloroflexota bacterium]